MMSFLLDSIDQLLEDAEQAPYSNGTVVISLSFLKSIYSQLDEANEVVRSVAHHNDNAYSLATEYISKHTQKETR